MEALSLLQQSFDNPWGQGHGGILQGPPGTGKTLMARAAANFTDSVFVSAVGSEFIEMHAGVGAKRVRELFTKARKHKRQKKDSAVIFIDEMDVIGAKRGKVESHMEYDQTLNQLLVELDGIEDQKDVKLFVLGATNRADLLDDALLRPGRFDRIVEMGLPDVEGRLEILKIHARASHWPKMWIWLRLPSRPMVSPVPIWPAWSMRQPSWPCAARITYCARPILDSIDKVQLGNTRTACSPGRKAQGCRPRVWPCPGQRTFLPRFGIHGDGDAQGQDPGIHPPEGELQSGAANPVIPGQTIGSAPGRWSSRGSDLESEHGAANDYQRAVAICETSLPTDSLPGHNQY